MRMLGNETQGSEKERSKTRSLEEGRWGTFSGRNYEAGAQELQ